jgi:hypothetical protein
MANEELSESKVVSRSDQTALNTTLKVILSKSLVGV